MIWIKTPKNLELPNQEITPENIYLLRREFLNTTLKFISAAMALMHPISNNSPLWAEEKKEAPSFDTTPESIASKFNNFYEFGVEKDQIWKSARKLEIKNWTIEVGGLVKKSKTLDVETLIQRFP